MQLQESGMANGLRLVRVFIARMLAVSNRRNHLNKHHNSLQVCHRMTHRYRFNFIKIIKLFESKGFNLYLCSENRIGRES
jgi:hypothetical protein